MYVYLFSFYTHWTLFSVLLARVTVLSFNDQFSFILNYSLTAYRSDLPFFTRERGFNCAQEDYYLQQN